MLYTLVDGLRIKRPTQHLRAVRLNAVRAVAGPSSLHLIPKSAQRSFDFSLQPPNHVSKSQPMAKIQQTWKSAPRCHTTRRVGHFRPIATMDGENGLTVGHGQLERYRVIAAVAPSVDSCSRMERSRVPRISQRWGRKDVRHVEGSEQCLEQERASSDDAVFRWVTVATGASRRIQ
jgi:hypothetical protein